MGSERDATLLLTVTGGDRDVGSHVLAKRLRSAPIRQRTWKDPRVATRQSRYIPSLDGLRALAVVLVLLFHSTGKHLLKGGFLGVDLFFVLSGYLITTQLLHPRGDLRQFYARRLARLWPALLVVVAFVTAVTAFKGGPPLALVAASCFVLNLAFAHHRAVGDAYLVSHMWSLAVEVQFYLAWGLILATGGRRLVQSRILLPATLGVAVASWAIRLYYAAVLHDPIRAYYATEARLDGLFIGSALAVVAATHPSWLRQLARPVVGLVLIAAAAASFHITTVASFAIGAPVAIVGTAAVIAGVLSSPTSRPAMLLASPPIVWTGIRSYSLYLWHFPVFVLLRFHTALSGPGLVVVEWVAALAIAAASYRLVEAPSREWLYKRIGSRRPESPATTS